MSLKNSSAKIKIPKFLKNKRINKIYKKFENSLNLNKSFAVAVSGGPDSLALAFLAKIYSIKKKFLLNFLLSIIGLDLNQQMRPNLLKVF